jgi:hypothetical protein
MVGPIGRGDGRSRPGLGTVTFGGAGVLGRVVEAGDGGGPKEGATDGADATDGEGATVGGGDPATDGLGAAVSVADAQAPITGPAASRARTSTDHRRGRMSIRR